MHAFAVVLLCLTLTTTTEQQARAEAERLANTGAYEEALKRFQALVAANPDDVESRLWIGRLHLRMAHPARAAAVFESIIATAPQNVDALLGLGIARIEQGRWREASDALNRAEALAADRTDVLAAQGRLHAAEGRTSLALAYYGRALAADPADAALHAAAEAVRAVHGHRVALGYDLQAFDNGGEMHSGTLEINARVNDQVRLFARGQASSFGGDAEGRGGGGIEWRVHRIAHVRVGALAGSNTVMLPRGDAFGELTLGARRARLTFDLRYFDFDTASLWIGGPGIAFDITPRVELVARYLRGRTGVDGFSGFSSDNGSIGMNARLAPTLRASLAYHRGIDHLDLMTFDRLTADRSNTVSGGLSADLTTLLNLSGGYDYQDRPDGLHVQRARAWLTVRF